jgi:hypothetical protein
MYSTIVEYNFKLKLLILLLDIKFIYLVEFTKNKKLYLIHKIIIHDFHVYRLLLLDQI